MGMGRPLIQASFLGWEMSHACLVFLSRSSADEIRIAMRAVERCFCVRDGGFCILVRVFVFCYLVVSILKLSLAPRRAH